ncbi:MAG: hypothetical protein LUG62_06305 [Clostridiales bacterium]|nr:hypothetical protein [Clostridiales bacterium]
MAVLFEIRQRVKGMYARYETYILPAVKFILAFLFFMWINSSMGYMSQLDNVFLMLLLALICCILPPSITIFIGSVLMVIHSYALGIEVAGFMLVLLLLMAILFLRFSSGQNVVLALAPLSLSFGVPALLPIGCGLLGTPLCALPAVCGTVLYYFVQLLRTQSAALMDGDMEIADKLELLTNGLAQNWEMWITVVAVAAVILLVYLLRTRSFDYAWRISIVAGGAAFAVVLYAGGYTMGLSVSTLPLLGSVLISIGISLIIDFFVFGGDYRRTERLEYEDDEYYYYVKAVPKAAAPASAGRNRRNASGSSRREKKPVSRPGPVSTGPERQRNSNHTIAEPPENDAFNYEKELEKSLKDL